MGIKAAPGIARDAVPGGWELEFVAVGRDLKEAVAWSPSLAGPATRATILPGGHTLTPRPGPPVPVAAPGPFVLDPNPAVTRAGLVEELARDLGAWKIDQQIAFLAADSGCVPRSPAPCGSSTPGRGTRNGSRPACVTSTSVRWTSGAGDWPEMWTGCSGS